MAGAGAVQLHPEKQPISFQDHGNPVRYRNIWVRELGKPCKPEFMLADSTLENYTGKYGNIEVSKDGQQLVARMAGARFVMFAESPTKFFAKTTDFRMEFSPDAQGKVDA